MRAGIIASVLLVSPLTLCAETPWSLQQLPLLKWGLNPSPNMEWQACGPDGFECGRVDVPMDYRNASNEDRFQIAVTRLAAMNVQTRRGSLFVVVGGPGVSGVLFTQLVGAGIWKALEGQYDILGLDPRGVAGSVPYVSCFESQLDEEVFNAKTSAFSLNLPSSLIWSNASEVQQVLLRQVGEMSMYARSVGERCVNRTGDAIRYIDTESVVLDFDFISKALYGEEEPINFWGFSYGTIIGQYLLKVLPRNRLGHIILDGVLDADEWTSSELHSLPAALLDIDEILWRFAQTCSATKNSTLCALGEMSSDEIVERFDRLLDDTYLHPIPLLGRGQPGVLTAAQVRSYVFNALHMPAGWPRIAQGLHAAMFDNNFSAISDSVLPSVHGDAATQPDSSAMSGNFIFCADVPPSWHDRSVVSPERVTQNVMESLRATSTRFGDKQYLWSLCAQFAADVAYAHRFEGNFSLGEEQLHMPVMILSNEYDPVTPLSHANSVARRLENNARLVAQRGGYGHCSLSQVSFCTAEYVRNFLLHDTIPEERHLVCANDELAFEPFDETKPLSASHSLDERDWALWNSWKQAGKGSHMLLGFE